jgi:hypothetical protein
MVRLKSSAIVYFSMQANHIIGFADMLRKHNIKYAIISGHIALLFDGNRKDENVEFLIRSITFERFLKFWLEFEKDYECLNTDDPIDAYNGYLANHHTIRIAKKGVIAPEFKIKIVRNEQERLSLKYRKQVKLADKILFISPLEILIPYKLLLGTENDIEDAKFLYNRFRNDMNTALLGRFLNELDIPQEALP